MRGVKATPGSGSGAAGRGGRLMEEWGASSCTPVPHALDPHPWPIAERPPSFRPSALRQGQGWARFLVVK